MTRPNIYSAYKLSEKKKSKFKKYLPTTIKVLFIVLVFLIGVMFGKYL